MIHSRGTGPQKRLSSEAPRLSPIMNQWTAGTVTARGKSHSDPAPHGRMNDSRWRSPFRTTCPSSIAIRSPGPATTRLTKLTSARSGVGSSQTSPAPGWDPHWSPFSAPAGGWKTMTSPTVGSPKRLPIRLTRIRCPSTSVGTIEGDGMRYGLTRKAWMPSARPNATATMSTSSSRELDAEDFFFTLLADVGGLLGLGGRRVLVDLGDVGRRLGLGKGLRVDGLARHLGARRRRGLGGRSVLFDLGDVGRRIALVERLSVARLARRLGIRRCPRLAGRSILLDLG